MPPEYTVSGSPTSQAWCGTGPGAVGTTIGFDVPGYSRAWIIAAQNGRIAFDGPMDLPMPPYTLRCPDDIGFWQTAAYEITPQGTRGNVIGQTTLNVKTASGTVPGTTAPPGVPPAPTGTPPPMGGTLYTPTLVETGGDGVTFQEEQEAQQAGFGLDLTTIALLALGALVVLPQLFSRRRGY